jgi:hypothetical protein
MPAFSSGGTPSAAFPGWIWSVVGVVAGVVLILAVAADIHVVEHHTDHVAADVFHRLLDPQQHVAGQLAVLDHQHGEVHLAGQHRGVAHPENRRAVHQHQVEALFHILDQLGHAAELRMPAASAGRMPEGMK